MILALDLSSKSSGYAVYDLNQKLITHGCITSSNTDTIARIQYMVSEIKSILIQYRINKIIVEEVRPDGILTIAKVLFWLQGQLAFMVHDNFPQTTIEYMIPSEWRKCCGIKTGKNIRREALKQADIDFVKQQFGLDVNDDEADAIGIGYGYFHLGK